MMTGTPDTVTMVPIDHIEVLNSRDRNMKVFEEIVENIRAIGLKKPITVAERAGDDGQPHYVLVCGEGRLNAFRILGETHIPALVVNVSDEDAFIMSLAENIARRGHRPLEILADIEVLRKRGYSAEIIIQKTGLSPKYVKDIVFLLDQGEERLIEGVQRGTIPLTTALEIARANENASVSGSEGNANLGDLLQEAYENGQLKGRQIIEAKRLIEKRLEHGPASRNPDQIKPPASSYSLVRTYQREVERQRKMVLKAEHAHQRLLLVVQGLKKLYADEHFVNLLRAEGLDTLPKYLAERIDTLNTQLNTSPITALGNTLSNGLDIPQHTRLQSTIESEGATL
ncbi:MAG: plasmid partitioning protein RepB C-terminal domain-containing protein [Limnohabitans sp.]